MIPKIIHYCWFGGKPLPPMARKCIDSWKRFCPDYEIKEWNESNFSINDCNYAREAYSVGKWAFVSDYARFKILYENGGLYFDTDVELVKDITEIVKDGPFMGCEKSSESSIAVAPGLGLGAESGMSFYKEILDFYYSNHFLNADNSLNLATVVDYTTNLLKGKGLNNNSGIQKVCGINIYPKEYFNPMDMDSHRVEITENTYSIHHYAASWEKKSKRLRGKIYALIIRIIGKNSAERLRSLLGRKK